MASDTVPTWHDQTGENQVGGSDPGGGREQPPFGRGFREFVRRADPPFPYWGARRRRRSTGADWDGRRAIGKWKSMAILEDCAGQAGLKPSCKE